MNTRTDFIQAAIDALTAQRYLEIGVFKRNNFDKVKARQRIGVDPYYHIPHRNAILGNLIRLLGFQPFYKFFRRFQFNEFFFQMPSDSFFEKKNGWLKTNPIDVCFVDGLHTYAQSLRDTLNALDHLNRPGIVLLHDCSPTSAAMAYPARSIDDAKKMNLPGWTGEWCGDAWKTIVYLRSQRSDLKVFVLNADYGVGVVCKAEPDNMLSYSREEIDRMTYEDLDRERSRFLNLKKPEYLNDFLKKFIQSRND